MSQAGAPAGSSTDHVADEAFNTFSDEDETAAADTDMPAANVADDEGVEDLEDEEDDDEDVDEEEDDDEEGDSSDPDTSDSEDLDANADKDETEVELERLVFGDHGGFRDAVRGFADVQDDQAPALAQADNAIAPVNDSDLFFLDDGTGASKPSLDITPTDDDTAAHPPAWHDSDDERMAISLMAVPRLRKLRNFEDEDIISGPEYTRRIRRQYEALHPRPAWANWDSSAHANKRRRLSEDSQDSDMELDHAGDTPASQAPLAKLLRDSAPLVRSAASNDPHRPPPLKPETIAMVRHPDIGPTQPHAITSIAIHPTLPLLLTAGLSSTMYLHRIQLQPTPPDPPNPLVTSLHLRHTPLTTAAFSPGGDGAADPKIYLSGPRRYFHTWTLPTGNITKTTSVYGQHETTQSRFSVLKPSPCGRYLGLQGTSRKGGGVVNVLSAATTQWIAQAHADGRGGLAGFAWWSDGEGLTLATKAGEVSEWSVPQRRLVARWTDAGAVSVTTLALGAEPGGPPATTATKKKKKRPHLRDGTYIGPDRHVALGQANGVVTLYDRRSVDPSAGSATAVRTLDALATPVSHLAVSPCGGVLAMASRWKRDALRLVHLPSGAVYRNWPTAKTPFGRVAALALGQVREGERAVRVLVVGNEAGALRVWEVGT